MAVVKMKELLVAGLKEELNLIGQRLVVSQAVEPIKAMPVSRYKEEVYLKDKREIVNRYTELEKRLTELYKILDINLELGARYHREVQAVDIGRVERRIGHVERHVRPIMESKRSILDEKSRLEEMEKAVIYMKGLNLPIHKIRNLKHIDRLFVKIPGANYVRVLEAMEELPALSVKTWKDQKNVWFIAFYPPVEKSLIMKILDSLRGEVLDIPWKFTGTPEAVLNEIRRRLSYCEIKLKEVELKLKRIKLAYVSKLEEIYVQITALNEIYKRKDEMLLTENLFFIKGWVPENRLGDLQREIHRNHPDALLTVEDVKGKTFDDSKPPTLLNNISIFQPFESFVKVYGIPRYKEVDPTALLAASFFLMFGIMFGDVGQGGVISLMGYWLYQKGNRDWGIILGSTGLSFLIFGVLYGNIFGYEHIIPSIWIRPMEDIQSFLFTTVLFGVGLILIGMILNIINGFREADIERIVFDKNGLLGMTFYVLLLIFGYQLIKGLPVISLGVFLGLETVIIIIMGMKKSIMRWIGRELNHRQRGIEIVFELFDSVIAFLSNTISFVRVGAFALNHIGLFTAVFLIARMMRAGGRETLGSWITVILGNIVIIGLEGLIVGIQALRLEYYEFFSKFYRGDGRDFQPMTILRKK